MQLHFLRLNVPILQQLQIEEALLRLDERNWCLVNSGSPPAIVMGISGKPELLLNQELLSQQPIPLIRRFSGGGTVVVDEHTLFTTFICNKSHTTDCCPEKIHGWAEKLYQSVFPEGFSLKENDYVIGDRKFGGNAQYLRKERWLHHSSLLWDYKTENMKYLKIPPKAPKYRQNRDHHEFLCRLKDYKIDFESSLRKVIESRYHVIEMKKEDVETLVQQPHRQATNLL